MATVTKRFRVDKIELNAIPGIGTTVVYTIPAGVWYAVAVPYQIRTGGYPGVRSAIWQWRTSRAFSDASSAIAGPFTLMDSGSMTANQDVTYIEEFQNGEPSELPSGLVSIGTSAAATTPKITRMLRPGDEILITKSGAESIHARMYVYLVYKL